MIPNKPVSRGQALSGGAKFLDVEAVARRYGASVPSIRRWADCGIMPRPVKIGSLCRWPTETLDKWDAEGNPRCDRRRATR